MDVLTRLFDEGSYENLLLEIFSFIDGSSLECVAAVSKKWRRIANYVFNLTSGWKSVPRTTWHQLDKNIVSLNADAINVVCGYDNGKVELRSIWNPEVILFTAQLGSGSLINVELTMNYLITYDTECKVRICCRKSGKCLLCHDLSTSIHTVLLQLNSSDNFVFMKMRSASKIVKLRLKTWEKLSMEETSFLSSYDINDSCLDGNRFAVGYKDKVEIWNLTTGKTETSFKVPPIVNIVSMHHSLDLVLTASANHSISVWRISAATKLTEFALECQIFRIALNRFRVVTSGLKSDLNVLTWNKDNELRFRGVLTGHTRGIGFIKISPTRLISHSNNGLLCIRDYFKHEKVRRKIQCSDGVNCMTADDRFIICGLLDKTIRVYDRKDLNSPCRILRGHSDQIWSMDQNKDHLVSGSWDCSFIVWEKKSFQKMHHHQFQVSDYLINSIKIYKEKLIFVALTNGKIVIFKLHGLKVYQILGEYGEHIYSMSISEHRNMLMSSHYKNDSIKLKVWMINDYNLMVNEHYTSYKYDQSDDIIWNIKLLSGKNLALLCHNVEDLDLFDTEHAKIVKTLKHKHKVMDVDVDEAKGMIFVGCQFGQLVVWSLQKVFHVKEKFIRNPLKIIHTDHSAAIGSVIVQKDQLVTSDYDGLVSFNNISGLQ